MNINNKDNLKDRIYIGKVVDNNDPEQEGRCRVLVYGLYETEDPILDADNQPTGASSSSTIPNDAIPWAQPGGRRFFAGGSSQGFADISIPKIDAIVQVKFIEGDIMAPEYYSIQNFNQQAQADISQSYLNSHIWGYDVDEELKLYYTPANGMEIFLKNSKILINPDASITIEHANGDSIIELIGTTINIVTQNNVNVTAQSNVVVTANKCTVDAPDIRLGENAIEAVIKGNTFQQLFNSHTHITTVPGLPTSPPVVPLVGTELSQVTKTL